MITARQKRLVLTAEVCVTVDRCTAEVRAVISLLQTNEFGPVSLPTDFMILARHAQSGFNAIGTTTGEKATGEAIGCKPFLQHIRKLNRLVVRHAPERVVVRHDIQLLPDRFLNRVNAIAQVHAP